MPVSGPREDESARNLLGDVPGSAPPRPGFDASYSVVLALCAAAALVWKLLAGGAPPALPFADAVLWLGFACAFAAFLRAFRSPAAALATTVVSLALAVWVPIGTAAFLYWLLRVRAAESSGAPGEGR